ncbi:MAG: putative rhamnosyl transferase [Bacteroidales bacterium]|nr:putative rhamnosyl transferase [Bacteroidales bacterium]
MPKQFQHIIITHFCFRGKNAFKHLRWPGLAFYIYPLTKKYLDYRFKLFEMLCLPGILGQSNQNFTWVLVIDKDLGFSYKKKLSELVQARKKTFLVEYNSTLRLDQLDWLKTFIEGKPDYILTSNHDDDDCLPVNFVEQFHKVLSEESTSVKLPPLKIFGCDQILQWDLLYSKNTPLGKYSNWHRNYKTSSCGFSLRVKYPEYNHSVSGMVHKFAPHYFNFTSSPPTRHVQAIRKVFLESSYKNKEELSSWPPDSMFRDISEVTGPVLMSNHARNAQYSRLYEQKHMSDIVTGPDSFNEYNIDWEKAYKYISGFKKNRSIYFARRIQKNFRKLKRKTIRKLNQYSMRIIIRKEIYYD